MSKKITIDEDLKKLELIVSKLENGETDLNDAIELYTDAMKIAKKCDEELKEVENNIVNIVDNNNSVSAFEIEN